MTPEMTLPEAMAPRIERLRYALKMYNESRTTLQSLASSVDDFLRDCVETSNPVIACECCSADFSGTEYGAACDGWRNGPDGWVCGQCLAYDQPPVVDEAVIRKALDECDVPLAYQSAIIAALTAALRGSGVQAQQGEPVAWLSIDCIGERYLCFTKPNDADECHPLYTQPQQASVPDGWVLVPCEATPEMWRAATHYQDGPGIRPLRLAKMWRAILAVAPKSEGQGNG